MRIGTKGLDLAAIAAEAGKMGVSMSQLQAFPELNTFIYHDGYHDGRALVCSSFVAEIWKAAGLFGDLEINTGEFTPKDVYQVKLFDDKFDWP